MRARLLAAVRALVTDPALVSLSDGARLACVVLTAKANMGNGCRTAIWAAELGRWLGVSQSQTAHTVLPQLRRAGALATRPMTNATGHTTGLECWIIPFYRARTAGDPRHALALSRVELVVLLRLVEALFGPGWTHRDGSVTPAGLLAGRTGRGAATDRLGLLLMVLSSNAEGWLRLCPGKVDPARGRPAATVARLLGCSPAAGAKVLKRLVEHGPVQVERRPTVSGLHARSRVRLVPVGEAHRRAAAEREDGRNRADRIAPGGVRAFPAFPDLAPPASGDHVTSGATAALAGPGSSATSEADPAGSPGRPATAHHHALHASRIAPVDHPVRDPGLSGEGRPGSGGLPERAGGREEQAQAPAGGAAAVRPTPVDAEHGGPLRGEKPQQQRKGVPVPLPPTDLLAVLAPVRALWQRLGRPYARRLVQAAVRRELSAVAGFAGLADAPAVLAERLTRRLVAQGGPGAVADPAGWLIGRGLPQQRGCGDVRCDEGLRLDGGTCATCEYLLDDRRAMRHGIAAEVDARMPGASPEDRRTEVDRRMHAAVTAEGWAKVLYRERVEAARAERRASVEATAVVPPAPAPAPAPVLPAARRTAPAAMPEAAARAPLVLEELTRDEVITWRARAEYDPRVVVEHIEAHGEPSARRLFTHRLVDRTHRLATTSRLVLGPTAWSRH
ncbi:hypothetical protein ACFXGI_25895 [Streptomyces sp. NPDC059355]|uniref:hypothetical protein n=1 Tax=Streptomyces sp. NPDC059355 TaxID=3346811 RepID=UPI00369E95FA